MINTQFQTDYGLDIKEEKKNIKKKEMDLDTLFSMKIQNIQALYLQDIIKMDLKF